MAEKLDISNRASIPSLSIEVILGWADAHFQRTGQWPKVRSGPIPEAPGKTRAAIEAALHQGGRGLPVGDSLYRLL